LEKRSGDMSIKDQISNCPQPTAKITAQALTPEREQLPANFIVI